MKLVLDKRRAVRNTTCMKFTASQEHTMQTCPTTAPTAAALDAAPVGSRQCVNCCHPVVNTPAGWTHLPVPAADLLASLLADCAGWGDVNDGWNTPDDDGDSL